MAQSVTAPFTVSAAATVLRVEVPDSEATKRMYNGLPAGSHTFEKPYRVEPGITYVVMMIDGLLSLWEVELVGARRKAVREAATVEG